MQYSIRVQYSFAPKFLCLFAWYTCVSKITLGIGYCTHPYTNATQKIQTRFFGANSTIHKKKQLYTIVHKFFKRPCTLLIPNPATYWPWRGFLPLHLTQCSTPFPSGRVQYSLLPWWMCAILAPAPPFPRNTNIFTKLNNLHQYST